MKRRTRLAAAALAGLVPVGLMSVGGVSSAFTDSASVGGVSLRVWQVPSVEPTCVQTGGWGTRDATLNWPSAGVGYTYQLRIYDGTTLHETRNMGSALSWKVPNGYAPDDWWWIVTTRYTARVVVTHTATNWVGPQSPVGTSFWSTEQTSDEGC